MLNVEFLGLEEFLTSVINHVAWEPLLAFRKLVPEVSTFQGTWELVGNFPNLARTVLNGWELIGNFYPLKSGTWGFFCVFHSVGTFTHS